MREKVEEKIPEYFLDPEVDVNDRRTGGITANADRFGVLFIVPFAPVANMGKFTANW